MRREESTRRQNTRALLQIKSNPAQLQVNSPPRKRKANLAANDRVWIDQADQRPFYTDKDGQVLANVRTGSASSSDVV